MLNNVHAFAEICAKCLKIGSKLSVKLTAQISDGFKKLFMLKTHCLYRELWTYLSWHTLYTLVYFQK